MKSQHRHELEKNELADWMTQYAQFFAEYWQLILAGLIGVLALIWLVGYLLAPVPKNSKEWRDYMTEVSKASPDDPGDTLLSFGLKNRQTTAGLFALELAADRRLAEGMQQQFIDRKKAKEAFTEAADAYVQVSQNAKDPFLLARSSFGAAQAFEGGGDLKKAIDYYNEVMKHDGEKALGKEAKRRVAMLEKKETAEWYDWFFKHPLQPVATRPQNREIPNPYSDLPDDPELTLPKSEDITKPAFTRPIFGPPPAPTPPEKKPETAPETTPEKKPETAPEKKPETAPEKKPETAPEKKPETKPEAKPEEKPAAKPEDKPEVKPETKPEAKPEGKV